MIIVGRPIEGICLNDLEFLLDENDEIKQFTDEAQAQEFLESMGVSAEEMYYYSFIEMPEDDALPDEALIGRYEYLCT